MKLVALLIAAAVAAALPSGPGSDAVFVAVPLPAPHKWIAGLRLFPDNVIEGLSANMTNHTADSWAAYVLAACRNKTDCTSCIAYSAINTGSTGGRFWFGFTFRGGSTSVKDYVRDDGVENSVAYSIAT